MFIKQIQKPWIISSAISIQHSFVTTNAVDGLLANDKYGNLVPSIAESWTVSKDGLTYTYKIRKDAKWVTAEGGRIRSCNC